MAEKTRYSDAELEEFRAIIMEKLQLAERDYEKLKSSIMNTDGNDTDDTSPTYKVLEEGANTLSKEETTRLAARQLKFIQNREQDVWHLPRDREIDSERTSACRASCYVEH